MLFNDLYTDILGLSAVPLIFFLILKCLFFLTACLSTCLNNLDYLLCLRLSYDFLPSFLLITSVEYLTPLPL
jgi:hypothetical protein